MGGEFPPYFMPITEYTYLRLKIKKQEEEIRILKEKTNKYDILENKVAAFYCNENGENPPEEGDLLDIGEMTATFFGWI